MHTNNFKLTIGDKNIGTVYLPNTDSTMLPVIIYCHGWGGKRQLWTPTQKLCDRAIKENMALVTFDFFGCGETGGDYSEMTYTRWKNNLFDVVSWVREQNWADKNKIGCYAFSSGSTAALRLGAEDDRISFIVSVGTCISTHIGMSKGGPTKLLSDYIEQLKSGGTVKIFGVDFGINFYIDTISKAPIHFMDKIKCPVLFLQGNADNTFRCADARMGYDLMRYANLRADYIELDGGQHELDNVADDCVENVFDWLVPVLNFDNKKELPTWEEKSKFTYDGTVEIGTRIYFGKNSVIEVTRQQYQALLKEFAYKTIPCGTSRDKPPIDSLEYWLKNNITPTAIASYIGRILLVEGYAEKFNGSMIKFVNQ